MLAKSTTDSGMFRDAPRVPQAHMEIGIDSFAAAFDEAGTSSESPSERLRNLIEQMNASSLPHGKIMEAIDLIGSRVLPVLHRDRVSATV